MQFRKNSNPKIVNKAPEQNKPNISNVQYTQLKDTENQPSGSNLKRTFSSPNIANLNDPVFNNDKITFLNLKETNTKIPEKIPSKPDQKPSTNNLNQRLVPSSDPKPQVNRSNKPIPERNLQLLDPIYGDVEPGLSGIKNLGNTCFMNSILQCLNSTKPLVDFFLTGKYFQDINRTNQLGFRGEIADEFSLIVTGCWSGHCRAIAPRRFKWIIGQFNQQFISNEQQDAQEFLLFLLDGLHEDLNRV